MESWEDMDRTIGLSTKLNADKEVFALTEMFKGLGIEKIDDSSGFGIRSVLWDANDCSADWKEVKQKIKQKFSNAKLKLTDSEFDWDDDDEGYEHLEIKFNA